MIVDMLKDLKEKGVSVSILSNNSSWIIQKCLRKLCPSSLQYTNKILGFEDVPMNNLGMPISKSTSILDIIENHRSNVMFLDDNKTNIRDMSRLEGVKAVLIERGGMNDVDVQSVNDWVQNQL